MHNVNVLSLFTYNFFFLSFSLLFCFDTFSPFYQMCMRKARQITVRKLYMCADSHICGSMRWYSCIDEMMLRCCDISARFSKYVGKRKHSPVGGELRWFLGLWAGSTCNIFCETVKRHGELSTNSMLNMECLCFPNAMIVPRIYIRMLSNRSISLGFSYFRLNTLNNSKI